jgi:hypothetical protein
MKKSFPRREVSVTPVVNGWVVCCCGRHYVAESWFDVERLMEQLANPRKVNRYRLTLAEFASLSEEPKTTVVGEETK